MAEEENTSELYGSTKFEYINGLVRKVSIGSDISKRIVFQVGSETVRGLKITQIFFDSDFLNKFGRVRVLVFVGIDGQDHLWNQIIDNAIVEYELSHKLKSNKSNEFQKNAGQHSTGKSGSSTGNGKTQRR